MKQQKQFKLGKGNNLSNQLGKGNNLSNQQFLINAAALQDHLSRQLFKLPKINQKLSLAQKLGLVPSPPKPLQEDEWAIIESQSLKREDLSNCLCPICLEKMRMQEHVILSCSHIYHKTCLESFEKVSQSKQCPICRKQDYEKKKFLYANQNYKLKAIVFIQAVYRGGSCRIKFYERLVKNQYQPVSSLLRRKLILYKLSLISSKVNKTMKQQQKVGEKVLANLKTNLISKQAEMQENLIKLQQLKQGMKQQLATPININWQQVKKAALERNQNDCSICLQSMVNGKVYVLSCSHMFHSNCLNAFERYSTHEVHCCPLCRSAYEKSHFQLCI